MCLTERQIPISIDNFVLGPRDCRQNTPKFVRRIPKVLEVLKVKPGEFILEKRYGVR